MHPARHHALALASASLRRASGAGASTSSSSGSNCAAFVADAAGSGGLDRNQSFLSGFLARGFASRRPKVAVLLKEDVEGLGKTGVEASVRPGYARNALLPSGAAELVPHRRARREARPPRSMLQEHLQQASEEDEAAAGAKAAAAAATATTTDETSPSRLVAVARSLSKGALESVRPLKMDKKGDDVSTRSSHKIAEPIDAETLVAAVASQKRISLAPELVILEKPIDEQGEHFVPLRMKLGGERVVMRALVGLAAASGGGNEKKGRKKKGGKR